MPTKNEIDQNLPAQMDGLTGCLDKVSSEAVIKDIMRQSGEAEEHVVIIIDIDDFKSVNRMYGRSLGDSMLTTIGIRLRKIVRSGDVVGRIDGGTFILFLRNMSNLLAINQKINELSFAFTKNLILEKQMHQLSCSMGISCFRKSTENPMSYSALCNQAESAMRSAKRSGQNQCFLFTGSDAENTAVTSTRLCPEQDLKHIHKGIEKSILLQAFQVLQSTTDITSAINTILEMIGKEFNVSRSYIFELSDDGADYCNTHEWCAAGVPSVKESLQKVPLDAYQEVYSLLTEDGIFDCDDTSMLGGEYATLHQEQGVKSFLQGVVREGTGVRLMLGLDDCAEKRSWTEAERTLVAYLSHLLGMFNRQLENHNLVSGFNKLKFNMVTDALTGLHIKEKFFSDTQELLRANGNKNFFFLLINVNKFQMINSLFGMEEGDRLLKAIASDFSQYSKTRISTYGRVGADIFCGCQAFSGSIVPELVIIRDRLKETLKAYNPDYNLTISLGVYEITDISTPIEMMYSKAFIATKKIKSVQITTYAIYHEDMEDEAIREQSIINDMYSALEEKQFEVYIQPKVSLQTTEIIGAEALIRWNHPSKGFLSPVEFIPIFEKNGLITKVDYFVVETVFIFLRAQADAGAASVPISVNLSRVDLFNTNIIHWFTEFLEKYKIDPEYLHIEITESVYTENYTEIIAVINQLKQLGFHIEMDDFGTGYSSLNMFSNMIVDTLKLDMNFLRNLHLNGDEINILSFIISLAKHFELPVVAEGIETEEQMLFLRDIGCDIGQGYYFAKPMPLSQFPDYLKTQKEKHRLDSANEANKMLGLTDLLYPGQQLATFFNTALTATGIFEITKGNIKRVRCNEEYYSVVGIEDRKSLHKNCINDVIHPDDLPNMFAKIVEAQQTQKTSSHDMRIIDFGASKHAESTEYRLLNIRFKLIRNSGDTQLYLASVFAL